MSYLAGAAFVPGVAGVEFVLAGAVLSELWLQPVTAPITRPNSTIRVHSLFIVGVTLTNSEERTSKNFALFSRAFLGCSPTVGDEEVKSAKRVK
jgi:hypothetical protein